MKMEVSKNYFFRTSFTYLNFYRRHGVREKDRNIPNPKIQNNKWLYHKLIMADTKLFL